jgi:hypothetical protein
VTNEQLIVPPDGSSMAMTDNRGPDTSVAIYVASTIAALKAGQVVAAAAPLTQAYDSSPSARPLKIVAFIIDLSFLVLTGA